MSVHISIHNGDFRLAIVSVTTVILYFCLPKCDKSCSTFNTFAAMSGLASTQAHFSSFRGQFVKVDFIIVLNA